MGESVGGAGNFRMGTKEGCWRMAGMLLHWLYYFT
jgi:hypothetical protein